ncbi:DUF3152 domain-containing protein [Actinoplanes sp. N902-109]|uniref:DUF3152 domain-containing protein n=1 Tax=Actinoplanes sp. (strain N902-109) TaxID=649831 RepID=UPI00059F3B1D|nr:DUF3152 domain-containing protein [Actinoplanes sp. N902-109]
MSGLVLLGGCSSAAPVRQPAAWHPAQTAAPNPPPATPAAVPPARITYPEHGSRHWITAAAQTGPAAGRAGTLLHYRVLVERDIHGLSAGRFADAVTTTLSDPRSWTGGGRWRLRRVGPGSRYDFTIYLATPQTRDRLCGNGEDGYTSCRNGSKVVLNVARWVKGVPRYGTTLATYRQYMVNHEVGHRLGQGHELCPGPGRPAPVMQQQTLGLHGCTANPWPYRRKKRWTGPPGSYDDRIPPPDTGRT